MHAHVIFRACFYLFEAQHVKHEVCAFIATLQKFSPVQETALYTAFWRHCETTRLQDPESNPGTAVEPSPRTLPLISDPLAKHLVNEFLPKESQARMRNDAGFKIARDLLACRTKLIDDVITRWAAEVSSLSDQPPQSVRGQRLGQPLQVVVLGAGMDTRPFRILRGREVVFIEVDRDEAVLAWKHEVLRDLSTHTHTHTHTRGAARPQHRRCKSSLISRFIN